MKILFVNAPVIRSKNSTPENDFKVDGFIFKASYRKIPGAGRLFNFSHKYFGLGKGIRYGVRAGSRWPFTMGQPMYYAPFPFFLTYAAAYVKSKNHVVDVLDAVVNDEYNYEKFIMEVKSQDADIVVVECSTPTIDIDLWFANKVSKFTDVALVGPHLDASAEEIQKSYPKIKYLLRGEYTFSIMKVIESLKPGIYESEFVTNLDSIPFPYRSYVGADKHYDPSMPTPRPQLQIYAGKGCPFKCTFCQWPQVMYGRKVTLRSPDMIIQEIKESIELHEYKSIFFDDDTFNMGNSRISELCDELKKIGLPWTMMGRLDTSPEWLYDKMVDSGCVGMRFGIETFNLDVLKNVKKGIERKDFRKILEYITNKHPQLMIHLTMMKDMPGQTEEIHSEDMKILKDLGYSTTNNIYRSYQLSICAPFPGTEMYKDLTEKHGGKIFSEYKLYDGGQDTVMKEL